MMEYNEKKRIRSNDLFDAFETAKNSLSDSKKECEKELEKREEDIIGYANVLSKDKLFQFLVKSLSDIYVTYEIFTNSIAPIQVLK